MGHLEVRALQSEQSAYWSGDGDEELLSRGDGVKMLDGERSAYREVGSDVGLTLRLMVRASERRRKLCRIPIRAPKRKKEKTLLRYVSSM